MAAMPGPVLDHAISSFELDLHSVVQLEAGAAADHDPQVNGVRAVHPRALRLGHVGHPRKLLTQLRQRRTDVIRPLSALVVGPDRHEREPKPISRWEPVIRGEVEPSEGSATGSSAPHTRRNSTPGIRSTVIAESC